MTLFASVFPILCWLAYNYRRAVRRSAPAVVVGDHEHAAPALGGQRHQARNPDGRDPVGQPDASVSFLASTSVLLVLAIFAAFGQLPALMRTLSTLGFASDYTATDMQVHLLVLLAIFVSSFFCLHAVAPPVQPFLHHDRRHSTRRAGDRGRDRRHRHAELAGGQEFQQRHPGLLFRGAGGRLVRFAAGSRSSSTVVTIGFIIHREFFSSAHRVAASVAVIASRREQANPPRLP